MLLLLLLYLEAEIALAVYAVAAVDILGGIVGVGAGVVGGAPHRGNLES